MFFGAGSLEAWNKREKRVHFQASRLPGFPRKKSDLLSIRSYDPQSSFFSFSIKVVRLTRNSLAAWLRLPPAFSSAALIRPAS